MSIFEKLPQEDVQQLWRYIDSYCDGSALPREKMDFFLRYWNSNKEDFFHMFGDEFILKKEIYFEKPMDELEEEMDNAVRWGDYLIQDFCREFKHSLELIFKNDDNSKWELQAMVDSMYMLATNEYRGESIVIPGQYTKNGRALQVNSGAKVVKMVGKIADAIGVSVKEKRCKDCGAKRGLHEDTCPLCGGQLEERDGYEAFRLAHSLVLNQKKVKGTMCLSIHPLDFLTMSDNDCGWTSCMSWMEEYGDYRLGTIEMMNSPCVVIAYVEAKDKMYVCGKDWSNKRWRQLYIVTPELILGNRQYPYNSDLLQGTAINWLRDLATKTVGWGPYTEEAHQIKNNSWNTVNGTQNIRFNLYTTYMYNDVYDCRLAYVAPTRFNPYEDMYDLCFSGQAICCGCGDDIEYDTVEAHRVLCRACDGHWRCDCCGDWHSEYDESYSVGDYVYCDWCYHHELEQCEVCGERDNQLNHVYIQVVNTENKEIIENFNYNYYISMCDCCFEDPSEYEDDYGPMYTVTDMWGGQRKAFDVGNISDRGLRRGSLSDSTIEFLRSMREEKSEEGRLTLIRKIAY
jgi:hypothetical protein